MTRIIDRRANYNRDKNINNRQRFIERVKGQIKENINLNIQKGKLSDLAKGEKIRVKVKDTREPTFNQDTDTGINDIIVPGNQDYIKGDTIAKPPKGGARGRKDEFMDLLFEDLELPEMVKKDIKGSTLYQSERRGYTTTGNPNNLDIIRSSKNAMGRRIALKRPGKKKLRELEAKLLLTDELLKQARKDWQVALDAEDMLTSVTRLGEVQTLEQLKNDLETQIVKALKKQKSIPYLDPIDVRYRKFDRTPKPITNAVMFCLMDVSGSMGEREKDIAKRFFLLLYLFLTRKYQKVEVVFIRHTTTAQEVDEETFFYDPLSGGTQISSGLDLIDKIITDRYDVEKTNIYLSQASDGENYTDDNATCFNIIHQKLIKKLQYFAYIEILQEQQLAWKGMMTEENDEMGLWEVYSKLEKAYKQFKARKIFDKNEIFTVFKDLFAKRVEK
jgi:uncharacterized sporulation protein YeaH/YhbH (DUF444 family)